MRYRGIILLILAAAVGALAVFMARNWIESQIPEPVIITKDKVPLSTVVVARRNLYFGDRLRDNFLQEVSWPRDTVPEGSFKTVEGLLDQERVVIREIAINEPILKSKITGEGGRATLSARISETMRAVTVRVNDVLGVAGFVLPGDRVDMLLTRELGEDSLITDILLQNIKVLGIDQNADDSADGAQVVRSVTIEVTPPQAQKIVLASNVGSLSLALRNYLDISAQIYRTVSMADLNIGEINQSPNEVAAAAAYDPRRNVTVTRALLSQNYKVTPGSGVQQGNSIDLLSPGAGAALPGLAPPAAASESNVPQGPVNLQGSTTDSIEIFNAPVPPQSGSLN